MYAVIKTGGKEYRVQKGDLICVEKLEGKVGDSVKLNDVLMISNQGEAHVGTPFLADASITGKIVDQIQGSKVLTFKMKRRKNYRRFKGHRQLQTYVRIEDIQSV
jgi:large subunit ribosomal protein L21